MMEYRRTAFKKRLHNKATTPSRGGDDENRYALIRACLGISGMNGNEGYWGVGISIISQNFPKSPSILFHPLDSSISQTSL
jgi:hypothetical protein